MDALVLTGIGEELAIQQIAIPTLEGGDALVKIEAAAFNRRDWWISKGQYAGLKFPIVMGSDGAGTVAAVGASVDEDWVGKSVLINPSLDWNDDLEVQPDGFSILGLPENGTFAEYVKVPATNLYHLPAGLSFEEAAALPLGGLTAFRAMFKKARLVAGEKVLISGVGGGVATFALQWAVAAGAEVYVTSGSHDKILKAITAGASGGVNYKEAGWHDSLSALSGGGFDVIIDSALGEGFPHFIDLANPGGRIVFYGATAGDIPAINGRKIFWKQLQIKGTTMGSAVDFRQMLQFAEQNNIRPLIDVVLPWQEAQKGLELMGTSSQFGKIVLKF